MQHVLALITRLKQICNFDPETGESAKAEFVLSHLDEICEGEDKVILFSQYVETLKILHNKMEKYQPLLYTGGLGDRQREEVIRSFKEDKTKQLLLLSLRAGGLGLDLPEANFVFHYDLWWNPAVQRQAEDRVHRIGQMKTVFVRRLLAA
ncbi:SWF/SNF helicase family protein, partial [Dehalococcoidales bacterium]|nr:SWF/SNF helicase family protein [Dehalococcoidales bacterium]